MNRKKSIQFYLFLITGGFAAAVNFISRYFLNLWFNFSISIILSYIFGMFTAYFLSRLFVFTGSSQSIPYSILFFIFFNVFAFIQTLTISLFVYIYLLPFLNIFKYQLEISHFIGILFPVLTSYYGHKYYTFKEKIQ